MSASGGKRTLVRLVGDHVLIPPPRPPDPQPVTDFNPAWGTIEWGKVRKPWLQVLGTVALATVMAWMSRCWLPGPWNLLALLGPLLIAVGANTRTARLAFGILLTFLFVASLIANDAAAHVIFETCLYD